MVPRVEPKRSDIQESDDLTQRGRRPTIGERVKSVFGWTPTPKKPLRGSDRRPHSPPAPARPKPEPLPKRANSMPRTADSTFSQSSQSTIPSVQSQPTTVLPPVVIPQPVAAPPAEAVSAPEVTSDAETLPLPGLPGATENENVPSPPEEEPQHTTHDPYVGVTEEVTAGEAATPQTHLSVPLADQGEMANITPESSGAVVYGMDIPPPTIPAKRASGTLLHSRRERNTVTQTRYV